MYERKRVKEFYKTAYSFEELKSNGAAKFFKAILGCGACHSSIAANNNYWLGINHSKILITPYSSLCSGIVIAWSSARLCLICVM